MIVTEEKLKRPRVAALAAALAALLASGYASASPQGPSRLAERLSSLAMPFKSHVAAVHDGEIYITLPRAARLAEGTLAVIKNPEEPAAAFGRVKSVHDNYAVVEILVKKGAIAQGISTVRGLPLPARVLWLGEGKDNGEKNAILSKIEEAVRDRGVFELPPPDVSLYFLEKFPMTRVENIPKKSIGEIALATQSDLVAIARVEGDESPYTVSVTLLTPEGDRLFDIHETYETEQAPAPKKDERGGEEAEDIGAPAGGKAGKSGFLQEGWSGVTAHAADSESSSLLGMRDRLKWKKYPVEGAALSAALVQSNAIAEKVLATAFEDKLRVYAPEEGALRTLWERKTDTGTRNISLCAYDLNGDGEQEIFVNAYADGVLTSYVVERTDGGYGILAKNVPYYFSASSDGALIAQKGSGDPRFVTGEVYTVTRTDDKLEFVPAFTLQGGEIPVGLNRMDIDGDGLLEVAGLSRRGRLLIFSQSGQVVWKGAGFGSTGRAARARIDDKNYETVTIFPQVLAVKDDTEGLLLAAGGAEYRSGGVFERSGLEKGAVRFMQIGAEKYLIRYSLSSSEGWISDLIDMSGGFKGRDDAVGFVRVYSGIISDESEIVLPAE